MSYAVKIVNKEETNAKDMYRELSIMSLFNHPNIVNFKVLSFQLRILIRIFFDFFRKFLMKKMVSMSFLNCMSNERLIFLRFSHSLTYRITGGELFDRVIELQRYSEHEASHVICQALLGLKHMHEKNIVHRDIKVSQ